MGSSCFRPGLVVSAGERAGLIPLWGVLSIFWGDKAVLWNPRYLGFIPDCATHPCVSSEMDRTPFSLSSLIWEVGLWAPQGAVGSNLRSCSLVVGRAQAGEGGCWLCCRPVWWDPGLCFLEPRCPPWWHGSGSKTCPVGRFHWVTVPGDLVPEQLGIPTGGPNGWRTFCLSGGRRLPSPSLGFSSHRLSSGRPTRWVWAFRPHLSEHLLRWESGSRAAEPQEPWATGPTGWSPRQGQWSSELYCLGLWNITALKLAWQNDKGSLSGSLQILNERWTLWLLSVLLEVVHTKPVWRREVPEGLISSTTSSSCQTQRRTSVGVWHHLCSYRSLLMSRPPHACLLDDL